MMLSKSIVCYEKKRNERSIEEKRMKEEKGVKDNNNANESETGRIGLIYFISMAIWNAVGRIRNTRNAI